MQEINQKKINLILPKATCIFMIILNFLFYILLLTKEKESNLLFIIYIIVYIIIYFLINDTLKNNNYSTYTKTICVSLSYSIFFTFGKFIAIVILLEVGVNKEDVVLLILIFFWILLDWILPIILLYYRSKVKNLCLNNSQNMILNNNLVQTNLIITPNVNYNNNYMQNNNQNSNYVQPCIPNLNTNVQSNEQMFNTPNVQPNYTNSNDKINNQKLDAPSNVQNVGAPTVQSNPQYLNNNDETNTGN